MSIQEIAGIDALRADGGLIHLRPVCERDSAAVRRLYNDASPRSRYLRFFSVSRATGDSHVAQVVRPAGPGHQALVACEGDTIVGLGEYERTSGGSAELAVLVADEQQHEGIGTLLVEHLAVRARAAGIDRFVAEVLAVNTAMVDVLKKIGFPLAMIADSGTLRVELDLDPARAAVDAIEDREQAAEAANLHSILAPRSVAVIGASTRPGTVGHEVLRNILAGGFTGPVYAVNPHHESVLGVPSVASPELLPITPDLVVVAVPAAQVSEVVRACGERGARGVVLLTAGFGETGRDGQVRQQDLAALAHRQGMRLIGPNCLGVLNTDPAVRLNATFAPLPMQDGGLGLVSQSGALGIAVVANAAHSGLGTAQFVSMGNKADVSGNDLLLAWERDSRVRVIALYLESLGNPRKFARVARRVSRRKPIIAIKAGRSAAGQRAGQSHTAAAAASDDVVDALFTQAGVLRLSSIEQMLDAARVLCDQPIPAGRRVAVIGNSGGPGILAADAAEGAGLVVVELSAATQLAIRSAVPTAASCQNPVDLGAAVSESELSAALAALLSADEVDAVLTVYTETAVADPDEMTNCVVRAVADTNKPVVATRVGATPCSIPIGGSPYALPVFSFPESAAAALGVAARYAAIRAVRPQPAEQFDAVDRPQARRLISDALAAKTEWLTSDVVAELLTGYGIPVSRQRVVTTVDAAAQAATEFGYPVALKLADPGAHKTERGGVRLNLTTEIELREAFGHLSVASSDGSVLVQPMASPGIEMIVGAVQHAQFGPLVMVGAGGTLADLLADRSFRLAPVESETALDMLDELRLARLLDGYRGGPVASRLALAQLVARVSKLVDDLPEIVELDLNPVVCRDTGLLVVDARIRIAPARPGTDPLAPQLS